MDTDHELCETVREYSRESWLHARHNETQRSAVSGAIIAISAAVVGFITRHELTQADLPLTLFLMFLGMFGAAFCAKHYERFSLHMEIIRESQAYLDPLLPGEPLDNIFTRQGRAQTPGPLAARRAAEPLLDPAAPDDRNAGPVAVDLYQRQPARRHYPLGTGYLFAGRPLGSLLPVAKQWGGGIERQRR